MKKLLTLFLLTTAFFACNTGNDSEKNMSIHKADAPHHENSENEDALVLNNGTKWKADSSTNSNVKSLLNIIEKFNNVADTSLTSYTALSRELQQGLNKMISDCKMQGADHEALHKWLEPLIQQVSKLKQASIDRDAATIFEAIHQQVKLYQQYFE